MHYGTQKKKGLHGSTRNIYVPALNLLPLRVNICTAVSFFSRNKMRSKKLSLNDELRADINQQICRKKTFLLLFLIFTACSGTVPRTASSDCQMNVLTKGKLNIDKSSAQTNPTTGQSCHIYTKIHNPDALWICWCFIQKKN